MSHHPDTPALTESHRRCLARFARWLTAVQQAPEPHRQAIVHLAARIDMGGMEPGPTEAAIDGLDELLAGLLAEAWVPRPNKRDRR